MFCDSILFHFVSFQCNQVAFSFFDLWVALKSTVLTTPSGEEDRPAVEYSLLLAGRLLGEKYSLDVGEDTTLGDGDTGEKLVQLFVVPDSELQVTGDDPGLLVVPSGITCQFEDLSCQVLHNGSQVDGCSGSYTLGVVTFSEKSVDSSNGELKSGTGRSRFGLGSSLASFATSRHVESVLFLRRFDENS